MIAMKFGLRKIIIILAAIFLLGVVAREVWLLSLPVQEVVMPPESNEDKMEIPPRPGVQGIMISGPRIQPLYFTIDLTRSDLQNLNWKRLERMDPWADIKVKCKLDEKGRIFFSQEDIQMEGHPEAGLMIQQALRTWRFTPYKTGEILFWFNMPSKGRKLMIDISRLNRSPFIPEYVPVYNGRLHYIEDISPADIQIGSHF